MDQDACLASALASVDGLPAKVFAVLVAELYVRGVTIGCENQSTRTDVLSKARSICGDSMVLQVLSRTHHFVKDDGVEDICEESDEIGPVKSMIALMELWKSLRDELVKQTGDNLNAGSVRKVVQDYLMKLMPNARAHHMAKLEHTHRVEEILNNLIEDGFCSYLDCKVLITAIKEHTDLDRDTELVQDAELVQRLHNFQDKRKSFCKEITLGALRDALASNPGLQLCKSVGTPFLVFQLSKPWSKLRYHTILSVLKNLLPWVSELQLQAVEGMADTVLLVYCGFEAPLVSLVDDLQKPEVIEGLSELKIVVKVESAPQPILAKLSTNATDSTEAPETDTDHDDEKELSEKKKQTQVLYEYVRSQDLHSVMENLLDLKEMMSSVEKTNYQVEEERKSHVAQADETKAKHEAELTNMHNELERFIDETATLRKEVASLKQEREETKTQQARQEREALQEQTASFYELFKQELKEMKRLYEDGIKAKEETEVLRRELRDTTIVMEEMKTRELRAKQDEIDSLQMQAKENSDRVAVLNHRMEDVTKQQDESCLRNNELKEQLQQKDTTIAQFDTSLTRLTNQLKEMREKELMAKDREIERLQMQVEEERKSHVVQADETKAKHEAELTTMHKELERCIDEAATLRKEVASLKQEREETKTQQARQEMEALQEQLRSLGVLQLEMHQLSVPDEEDHTNHGSTTTLSSDRSPGLSPSLSPEDSLVNGVYSNQSVDTAGQNVSHSECVTNNTETAKHTHSH